MKRQHIILTRFAVKTPGSGFSGSFPPGWLERRFSLFEQFCLPSVQAQSDGNFRWLLFVHPQFNACHEAQLRAYDKRIEVVRTSRPSLAPHVEGDLDIVSSTRLDSDDALNRDAIERTTSFSHEFYVSGKQCMLHNFPRGCKLDTMRNIAYLTWLPNSAFLTMFERPLLGQPVRGALAGNHSRMVMELPTIQDDSICGWLMVVHGSNVANSISRRDEMAPVRELGHWFSLNTDPTTEQDGDNLTAT